MHLRFAGLLLAILAAAVSPCVVGCRRPPAAAHRIDISCLPNGDEHVRLDGELVVQSSPGGLVPDWQPLIDRLLAARQRMERQQAAGDGRLVPIGADDGASYETLGSVLLCGAHAGYLAYPALDGRDFAVLKAADPAEQSEWRARVPVKRYGAERAGEGGSFAFRRESDRPPSIRIDLFHVEPWSSQTRDRAIIRLNNDEVGGFEELRSRLDEARQNLERAGRRADDVAVLISPDMVITAGNVKAASAAARGAGFRWIYFGIPK